MGVVWLAVPGAGTSGHQRLDAPAINKNRRTVNASLLWRMLNTQNTGCVERGGEGTEASIHGVGTLWVGMPSPKLRRADTVSMEENARTDCWSHGKMCFITSPTVATGEVALPGFQRTDG